MSFKTYQFRKEGSTDKRRVIYDGSISEENLIQIWKLNF